MNIVVDQVVKAFGARKDAKAAASKNVYVGVMVGDGSDFELASALKSALRPKTSHCKFYISGFGLSKCDTVVHTLAQAVVVLAGTDSALCADVYRAYAARGVPCRVLVDPSRGCAYVSELVKRGVETGHVAVCEPACVEEELGRWLLRVLPDYGQTLGAGLACCQDVLARRVVLEAVRNNAMIAAAWFLKGADAPAMAANEVAMVFKLAATYDLPMGRERVPDVAAVAVASLASKAVSGLLAKRIPLPKTVINSAVASFGTLAVGGVAYMRCRSQAAQTATEGDNA